MKKVSTTNDEKDWEDDNYSNNKYRVNTRHGKLKECLDLKRLTKMESTVFETDSNHKQIKSLEQEFASNFTIDDEKKSYKKPTKTEIWERQPDSFEEMAKKMEKVTDDAGVLKMVIKPGDGPEVAIGAFVTIHYDAYLEDFFEIFDSSRNRRKPLQFRLVPGTTIPGLTFAVASMRRTELACFIFRPEYFYGSCGCPPRIPAGTSALYEIELISFIECAIDTDVEKITLDEINVLDIDDQLDLIRTFHELGNKYFRENNDYFKAHKYYKRAIKIIEQIEPEDYVENCELLEMRVKLYLNCALISLKRKCPQEAISYCNMAIRYDSSNPKAFYRMGVAYRMLEDYENSKTYLLTALKMRPRNPEICRELKNLNEDIIQFNNSKKQLCMKMLQLEEKVDEKPCHISNEFQTAFENNLQTFINNQESKILTLDLRHYDDEKLNFILKQVESKHLQHRIIKQYKVLHIMKN